MRAGGRSLPLRLRVPEPGLLPAVSGGLRGQGPLPPDQIPTPGGDIRIPVRSLYSQFVKHAPKIRTPVSDDLY